MNAIGSFEIGVSWPRRALIASALVLATIGCALPASPTDLQATNLSAELEFCAQEINRFRATAGRPALARSSALEDFAAQAATTDGLAHIPHHHFSSTGGAGMATAETEILWWSGYPIRAVIEKGLAQMWLAGPSGEHYDILAGGFSQVGCGIFVNGSEVTIAQDFR